MNLLWHVILCFFLFAVLWDYSHHSLLLPWEFAVPVRILFIQHCSESFSDIANVLYGDWRNENTFNAIQVKPDIHCSLLWSILFCYDRTMGWIGKYLAIFHCYIRVWEFIWQFLNLKLYYLTNSNHIPKQGVIHQSMGTQATPQAHCMRNFVPHSRLSRCSFSAPSFKHPHIPPHSQPHCSHLPTIPPSLGCTLPLLPGCTTYSVLLPPLIPYLSLLLSLLPFPTWLHLTILTWIHLPFTSYWTSLLFFTLVISAWVIWSRWRFLIWNINYLFPPQMLPGSMSSTNNLFLDEDFTNCNLLCTCIELIEHVHFILRREMIIGYGAESGRDVFENKRLQEQSALFIA